MAAQKAKIFLFLMIAAAAFQSGNGCKYFRADERRIDSQLNKALTKSRPFLARISGIRHSNIVSNSQPNSKDIENAERDATQAVSENRTSENLQALGKVYYFKGEFRRALTLFEESIVLKENANSLANIGAVWFELANQNGNDLQFLSNSLSFAGRSIAIDSENTTALFNRAITLERLSLVNTKKTAWRDYLALEHNSAWREEGKTLSEIPSIPATLQISRDQLISDFAESFRKKDEEESWNLIRWNRESITGKLLQNELGDQYLQDRSPENLAMLEYAGVLEFKKTGDPFWRDIATFFAKSDETTLNAIVEARSLSDKADAAAIDGDYQLEQSNAKLAIQKFNSIGDVWDAAISESTIAISYYTSLNKEESTRTLKKVQDFAEKHNYYWLRAHARFWIGVNLDSDNRLTEASELYELANNDAERVSDGYNSEKILSEVAATYRVLGRRNQALKILRRALNNGTFPGYSVRQRSRTYNSITSSLYSTQDYETAAAFQRENLELLKSINDPAFYNVSQIQLGQIYHAQKLDKEASQIFTEARHVASQLKDATTRDYYLAHVELNIAEMQFSQNKFDEALVSYDRAIGLFDSVGSTAYLYAAHKGKLFCLLRGNKDEAAEKELSSVLILFDNYRNEILDEESRNAFFSNEQSVFDAATEFEYRKGNLEAAYNYSEQSRSRTLLDLFRFGGEIEHKKLGAEIRIRKATSAIGLDSIRKDLPENIQVVEYSVLPDRILIWLVSKNSFEVFEVDTGSQQIETYVDGFIDSISKKQIAETTELNERIYEALIKPIRSRLDTSKVICFVPDKSISKIPFAALKDSQSKKFLIQDFTLFVSPSANALIEFTERAARLNNTKPETLLAVGNPAFDRAKHPELDNLPAAESEVSNISKFYKRSKTLIGTSAIKDVTVKEIPRYDIFHFAGHYVIDQTSVPSSALIFAKTGGSEDTENLFNYEIQSQYQTKTKLVILSACDTGGEFVYHGEGIVGASRAFLSSGIPVVIGSQWEVDSFATEMFMRKFHSIRTQNVNSVEALRKTQNEFIKNPQFTDPYFWSPFVLMGGYSSY